MNHETMPRSPLCRLPAPLARLWLARSDRSFTATTTGKVLLDGVPEFLDTDCRKVTRHG